MGFFSNKTHHFRLHFGHNFNFVEWTSKPHETHAYIASERYIQDIKEHFRKDSVDIIPKVLGEALRHVRCPFIIYY